jgi:Fe2+ transport system protein FeoA
MSNGGFVMIKTLNQMTAGNAGVVTKVTGHGSVKRRIIDMGIVAGSRVTVQKFAPLGDPMEVKVKNFNLSLRKSEAALIEVQLTESKQEGV